MSDPFLDREFAEDANNRRKTTEQMLKDAQDEVEKLRGQIIYCTDILEIPVYTYAAEAHETATVVTPDECNKLIKGLVDWRNEAQSILAHMPEHAVVHVREGGGVEDSAASLAVSVSNLGNHYNEAINQLRHALACLDYFRKVAKRPNMGLDRLDALQNEALAFHKKHRPDEPLLDACTACGGWCGGVPGNENIVNQTTMCDDCSAVFNIPKE